MADIYNPSPLTLDYQQQTGSFSLRLGDQAYVFPVSPEDVEIDLPARQTVYQTLGSQTFLDHLGPGVGTISISGHTGWRPLAPSKSPLGGIDGYISFQLLRSLIDTYNDACAAGNAATTNLELVVSAPDKFGVWRVSVEQAILKRSVQQPLLFRYELRFTILKAIGDQPESFGVPGLRNPPFIVLAAGTNDGSLATQAGTAPPDGALPGLPSTQQALTDALAQQLSDNFGLGPIRETPVDFDPSNGYTIDQLCQDWYADNADLYAPIVFALNGIGDPNSVGAARLRMPVGVWEP